MMVAVFCLKQGAEMTQQAKISLMILSLVNSGIDIKAAIDQIAIK